MKKFLALCLMASAPLVSAVPVEVHINCPAGGSRDVTGEYSPITGEFSTETVVTNCAIGINLSTNGTVTASGVLLNGELQANITTDLTSKKDENTVVQKCQRQLSGLYDIEKSIFEGSDISNCEKTGYVFAPIGDVIAGFSEQESAEKTSSLDVNSSLIVGTWSQCSNGGTVEIRADGTARTVSDGVTECAIGKTGITHYIGGQCIPDSPLQNDELEVKVIDASVNDGKLKGSVTIVQNGTGSFPIDCSRRTQ